MTAAERATRELQRQLAALWAELEPAVLQARAWRELPESERPRKPEIEMQLRWLNIFEPEIGTVAYAAHNPKKFNADELVETVSAAIMLNDYLREGIKRAPELAPA